MKSELKNILHNFNVDKAAKLKLFKSIGRIKKKNLDLVFQQAHDKVFSRIDCLECANCCKTTSPIFRDTDIKKLSKHLKMKAAQFVDMYLYLDKEQDYVLKSSPCTFLNDDNKCSVYESRPLACKGYPHTNRKNVHQLLKLTEKNTEICPAACQIIKEVAN